MTVTRETRFFSSAYPAHVARCGLPDFRCDLSPGSPNPGVCLTRAAAPMDEEGFHAFSTNRRPSQSAARVPQFHADGPCDRGRCASGELLSSPESRSSRRDGTGPSKKLPIPGSQRTLSTITAEPASWNPLPEEPAAPPSTEASHDIRRAFTHLKPRERDLLWMAYVECFDHKEIAEVLRIGTASIRPMLARARAKFGDILRRRGLDVS